MRKIIAAEYLTLDGMMNDPAWTSPYWNDELAAIQESVFTSSDLLLMGRVTYDGMSKAWPQMTEPGAEGMNRIPKLVATTTLQALTWNATAIKGNVFEAVQALRQGSGENVLIYGSGTLVRGLLAHDLIDEYRLMIFPVILGKGTRLFLEGGSEKKFKLANTTTTNTGVAALTYERNP